MDWTPEQRGIFGYLLPSGEKRYADPLDIRRMLIEYSEGKIDEMSALVNSETIS